MGILYQSLKHKTIQEYKTIQHLQAHQDVASSLKSFKEIVEDKLKPEE